MTKLQVKTKPHSQSISPPKLPSAKYSASKPALNRMTDSDAAHGSKKHLDTIERKAKKVTSARSQVRATSKLERIVEMMRARRGVSVEQLAKATGWQHHSVRGAISGAIKKRLGLKVVSELVDGGRVYRIVK